MSKNEYKIVRRDGDQTSADARRMPPLPFDAERAAFVIAKALHIASKSIFDEKHPAYSDAEDMRTILLMHYHHAWFNLLFDDDFAEASALGYNGNENDITATELSAWLAAHRSRKN